ncbi:MAG: flagellar hook basal-body protein [Fuerstiella sp.]|jgi:flagellar basal body rod protein FlgG|nr:flagellar hook basal-body protein [Fuerstiella sp.]MCP4510941.1 flagellar hook basal-body protein [Fuerstiella sp.]MDG2128603.1 flagellar hook basal-body protein [Fuerstiella sp.]
MISGLYSAATAMDAAAMRHETSATNLANAHLPGFRRRVVSQTPFDVTMSDAQEKSEMSTLLGTTIGTVENAVKMDFSQGGFRETGGSFDVALSGDGFFVVEGPEEPLYTRNGQFVVSGGGELMTVDQLPVLGVNGPIVLPPDATGLVNVDNQGRFSANGIQFGQLETVRFPNRNVLTPVGASLFQKPNDVTPEASNDEVLQGRVELGNVDYMDELVNIMVASRQYEAAQRVLNSIDDSVEKHINT